MILETRFKTVQSADMIIRVQVRYANYIPTSSFAYFNQ